MWVAISSALNSDTAITRRARLAAAAKPRRWKITPRRVKASGITIGAASCTVTTSGTFPVGGTAGDGACTRSTGATRRTGPAAPEQVPRVVEHRGRQREDDRVEPGEVVGTERTFHLGAGVTGGERGHGDAVSRE